MIRALSPARRIVGGAFVPLLLALAIAPGAAHAQAYGELTRFGEGAPGEGAAGSGQINDQEQRFANGEVLRPHLIGVDPTDNSVFVLDEPEAVKQKKKSPTKKELSECEEEEQSEQECLEVLGLEGPITRKFRIQKFSSAGGSYHVAASTTFSEESPSGRGGLGERSTVEGIAVDPARKRLYVLTVDDRKTLGVDESTFDKFLEGEEITKNEPVASTLYAFSTQESGKTLPAAGTEGPGKEVLTNATTLAAQSTVPGQPILEPTGITVDPENGNVVIAGHIDAEGKRVDNLFAEKNEASELVPSSDHFVLERIDTTTGQLVAGEAGRYVDTKDFFKKVPEGSPEHFTPNSPVVVGSEHSEQIDLAFAGGIAKVPADFTSKGEPEVVYKAPAQVGATQGRVNEASLLRWGPSLLWPTDSQSPLGGVLSASPSSEGSVLYSSTITMNEQPAVGESEYASVMAISAAQEMKPSWVGGQNLHASRGPGEPPYSCVINPAFGESYTPVAAGSGGRVFVLAQEYLEKEMLEAHEKESYGNTAYPGVIEFGPGGSGCPPANGGGLVGEVGGQPVAQVEPGDQVTFSSYVNQASGLSVEWEYGDGTTETVTNQFHCPPSVAIPTLYRLRVRQCPSAHHVFSKPGEVTVTEKVHTDDLSTPLVTQTLTLKVGESGKEEHEEEHEEEEHGGSGGPIARVIGPTRVEVGTAAEFDGKQSSEPKKPNAIRAYHWNFGDGTPEETTTTGVTFHPYSHVGSYRVSLRVTDAEGNTSERAQLPSPVEVYERGAGPSGPAELQSAESPSGGTVGYTAGRRPVPNVRLASASLVMGPSGTVPLVLYCPTEESACAGNLSLSAIVAGSARGGKKSKSSSTTLANGSFTLAGGHQKRIVVKLSAKARSLVTRLKKLIGSVTIAAHDASGTQHTTRLPVVLSPARKRGKH